MNMNNPKFSLTFIILTLLGILIFWGCTTGQTPSSSQNDPDPNPQISEPGSDETETPVAEGDLVRDETPIDIGEESSVLGNEQKDYIIHFFRNKFQMPIQVLKVDKLQYEKSGKLKVHKIID